MGANDTPSIDVANSRPLVAIVLPKKPTEAEQHAAAELRRCLALMTKVALPVTEESRRKQFAGRVIHVGRTQLGNKSIPAARWEQETILLDTRSPEEIVITGGSDTAVLFAVYRFLGELGCRWLKPGNAGEIVPRRQRLEMPSRRLLSAPDFAMRGWMGWFAYSLIDMGDKGPYQTDHNELRDWGVRNGLNSMSVGPIVDLGKHRGHGYRQRQGHTLIALLPSGDHPDAKKFFTAHPEYYPLVGGSRVLKYKDGRPAQACLSNPEVAKLAARHILAYLQEHPGTRRFSVAHNDEPSFWCECVACRALDAPSSAWKTNSLYDAYPDRSPAGPGPMSDRYVDFVNRVARLVGAKHADAVISFYAYGSTVAPPRRPGWKLEKNVMIEYANDALCFRHPLTDPSCKANKTWTEWLTGWARSGRPVVVYDYHPYPTFRHWDLPVLWYSGLADYTRHAKKTGVHGWAGEGSAMWSGSALWYYVKANLLWDSSRDVKQLIADFCDHYYGPAAATMTSYYDLLDSVTTRHPEHLGIDSLEAITPALLAQAEKLLQHAVAKASAEPAATHVTDARVAFLALRINLSQKQSRTDPEARRQHRQLVAELAKLLRSAKTAIPISNALYPQLTVAGRNLIKRRAEVDARPGDGRPWRELIAKTEVGQ